MNERQSIRVVRLYTSPGHNFFGRHGEPAGVHPLVEHQEIQCLAGRGVAGDRFLDRKKNYSGQITFFALEVFEDLCRQLNLADKHPGLTRRNVITRGIDLNTLVGTEFDVQGVRFRGVSECTPCHWMDHAFAPGAEAALRQRGGLRGEILSNGPLRVSL